MANEEHLNILMQGVEVWNQWRYENPEVEPDLSYAFLLAAKLVNANFSYTNLKKANLQRAVLSRVNLHTANLSGANLDNVWMSECYFDHANLQGANLNYASIRQTQIYSTSLVETSLLVAHLQRVDLTYSNLRDADFTKAGIRWITFNNNNLNEAKGLDSITHLGPSTIGIDTLYLSRGNIPEVFLRGCGVPENFITHMRSLVEGAQPIQFYSCFISYSHADKSFARRLHDALQGRGIRCWLDEHQLLPGDDIYKMVDQGIRLWDKVLLCCSKDSLTSWWV
ncbi:MAG TPA: toll/interleukin-1 receptor domain-containing protein, partial [Pyrinomonadaceae bacterium]|nr:toll/interleukin-1 receptor domain-containing protein [Pyrinomonadaceae bacterium]